ncbi:FliO/MopB family protein [Desulfobulbus elongatus]|uniref:FliO/MopB family protein n=1 Tax=Desulfobulbus elongatus TaxID=53332 RepID=UPI0004811729|nr:flagellar biosynthetic protein FliO [Desulfobulbus elongatus]
MARMPVLLLILWPASAWAAEPPDMTSALLRTGWALLVVVGLIFALYGLSKKRLLLGRIGGNAIRLIEVRPLQPRATLALVEVRGREYLLGISANSIHLLADLSGDSGQKPADFSTVLAEQS